MTREIPLSQGKTALVDDADFEWLRQFNWCFSGRYARRGLQEDGRQRHRMMHHAIMGRQDGYEIDHINGNKLDNRRSNLRFATRADNQRNKTKYEPKVGRSYTSRFKGVRWDKRKGKWEASLHILRKTIFIGYYVAEQDAAQAYDDAARKNYGEFARCNFED